MSGKPKGLSCREDVLTPQELSMLLAVASSIVDRFIVYSLLFGGLRVSELKHFNRSWANLEEGTITVPTRQYCNCAECRRLRDGIWRPKTKKGARTIVMHPLLLPVLKEFFAANEELRLSRVSIWNHVKKLAKQAHIWRNIYPHCMRATAATTLAYEKISAPSLKYIMGWSSLQAAEDYVKSDMHMAHSEIRGIYDRGKGN